MKRTILGLVTAVLVTLGLVGIQTVAAPVPAHAAGAACWAPDNLNQVYWDWHESQRWQVYDSYDGRLKWIDTDIWSFRYSDSNGQCQRAAYSSTWTEDGTGGYFHPHLRAWVCGAGPQEWDGGTVWGSRSDVITSNWTGVTEYFHSVYLPSGQTRTLAFAKYMNGPFVCNPQGDNLTSDAHSPTWSTHPTSILNGAWYASLHP